jgi:hypothetical protein
MDWFERLFHLRRHRDHDELIEALEEAIETIREQQTTIDLQEQTIAELVAEVDRLTGPPPPVATSLIIRTTTVPKGA